MTVVVLGLDGAAFELLKPWIDDGTLPTLGRLCNDGIATDMQSCLPPVSCPNWQCYATGTNPGKLGVYWWEHIDAAEQSIESTNESHQFDGHYYWEYVQGDKAIINLPTSYPPPTEVNGIHIAGGPGAEQSGYTTPPSLETELESTHDYQVHPEHLGQLSAGSTDNECIEEIYRLIDARFDVLEKYVESGEYDLVHATVFYINVLHHFYWDDEIVRRAWKRIDERLVELIGLGELESLFIMSDHGSNEIDVTFLVNVWLEREGYLKTTRGVSDFLHRLGITREKVRPIVTSLGLELLLRRLIPTRIQTMLPDSAGSVTKEAKGNVIDWEESTALASGQGPLYVLEDDPEEHDRIRKELIARLDGLEWDGRRIVEAAIPAEDVYDGPHLDRAPDIILRQGPGVHIAEAIGGDRSPFESPTRWRGENKETGLFVAYGPDIDPGADLDDMHILDIAPTVLHLLDTPVPSNLDGEVRTDLFVDGSAPATRELRTQSPLETVAVDRGDTESEVSDRLNALGYLQ